MQIGRGLVSALFLASLSGVVCGETPLEVDVVGCETHVSSVDTPMGHAEHPTEDCCKPDRTSKNPAALKSSLHDPMLHRADVALATFELTVRTTMGQSYVFSASRGSPSSRSNRPADVPLLA